MTAGCGPRAQRLADWEISWPGRCRTRRPEPVVPGGTTEGEQRRAHRAAARAEPARLRRQAIAVDGKCLRGARRPDGSRVFILSAVRHGDGVTLASHTAAPGQLQGEDGRGAPRLGADPPAREGQAGNGRPEAVREPVVLYRWRWALRATLSLCGCSGTTTGWPVPMDTVGSSAGQVREVSFGPDHGPGRRRGSKRRSRPVEYGPRSRFGQPVEECVRGT